MAVVLPMHAQAFMAGNTRQETGSGALGESCTGKIILMNAWKNAREAYSKTVAEWTKNIGVVSKGEYETLVKAMEQAHKWMMDAQINLERHVKQHGCGERDDGNVAA
jgi:hypothetical protein